MRPSRRSGYTLVEILTVLTICALTIGLATPALDSWINSIRIRSALDIVSGQIYFARMQAIRTAHPTQVVLSAGDTECVEAVRVRFNAAEGTRERAMDLPGAWKCIRHSGDSIITFNGRGMIRPPTRSIYAEDGNFGDTIRLSIAGRLRRTY